MIDGELVYKDIKESESEVSWYQAVGLVLLGLICIPILLCFIFVIHIIDVCSEPDDL